MPPPCLLINATCELLHIYRQLARECSRLPPRWARALIRHRNLFTARPLDTPPSSRGEYNVDRVLTGTISFISILNGPKFPEFGHLRKFWEGPDGWWWLRRCCRDVGGNLCTVSTFREYLERARLIRAVAWAEEQMIIKSLGKQPPILPHYPHYQPSPLPFNIYKNISKQSSHFHTSTLCALSKWCPGFTVAMWEWNVGEWWIQWT